MAKRLVTAMLILGFYAGGASAQVNIGTGFEGNEDVPASTISPQNVLEPPDASTIPQSGFTEPPDPGPMPENIPAPSPNIEPPNPLPQTDADIAYGKLQEAAELFARGEPGDTERALELANEALPVYIETEGEDGAGVAWLYGAIGNFQSALSHQAEADAAYAKQIDILRRTKPGSIELAYALQARGQNLQGVSRYADSLVFLTNARALMVALDGDMTVDVGNSWLNAGISYEGLKRYDEAIAAYQKAAARYDAALGMGNVSSDYALNNIAWVYRRQERLTESYALFKDILPRIEAAHGKASIIPAKVYINLGILSQLLGRNEDSVRWNMRALVILKRDPALALDDQRWCYESLSHAFEGLNDKRHAILFAKLAIDVQQQVRGNNKTFSKEELKDFKAEWSGLYQHLADLLISEGRLSEAQRALDMEKDEELYDFTRRDGERQAGAGRPVLSGDEAKAGVAISGMMGSATDLSASDANAIDLVTALTLLDEVSANGGHVPEGKSVLDLVGAAALLQREKEAGTLDFEASEKLPALEAALDAAYSAFMDDVDTLMTESKGEQADARSEVEKLNLDYTADIQDELRAFNGHAAMLQIASLGEATHLFLTVPEAAVHREVAVPREKLARMVFDALQAIDQRSPKAIEALKALREVLFAPIEADVKASGVDTLMLNLQGFLRYVPFAALTDGKRYLVEDYALALYTPAARTHFQAAAAHDEASAGFGVTRAHPGFSALPGVATEMAAIFGNGSAGSLKGNAALDDAFTRESFAGALKQRPGIVHIASHFQLEPGRETDSFLLLGDGDELTLADIRKGRNFRFGGVDLLTLSACQTARGGEGDEVESFGALAQMNGASAVMATLWPVADEATAEIMQDFYRNYVDGDMTKAEALRQAQIAFLKKARGGTEGGQERSATALHPTAANDNAATPDHPYYWSPFILMGNWL